MSAHPDVNYFYFGRNIWARHRGVATVGIIPDYEAGTAKVAFAFCSPLDAFRRFSEGPEMPRRERVEEPAGSGKYITRTVMVPNPNPKPGGADLVNARLGLVPDSPVKANHVVVPVSTVKVKNKETGEVDNAFSLIRTAVAAFNAYPSNLKPRIWKNRRLVYGSIFYVALENCRNYSEALVDTAALYERRKELVQAFVPRRS